ncbi:MAG: hypothetical protein CVU54_09185 [Deltaproteobacteria bacterium HGW-Deltaproteobacteria-12]|jgi:hypothetical protein|nr:MAG: hypothetical protein CVU54_09185 [Deltaproteobacteria bacterium HGW-Deltaproteobacteria-12]
MASVFIFSTEDATTRSCYNLASKKGHALETILPLIQENSRIEYLRRIYPDGICYLWGARESEDNLSTWNLMDEGDLVLGWNNRLIVSASYVLMKVNHPLLATRIWNNRGKEPFSLICFMDEPHTGEVPIVSQMLRYLDQDFTGFTKLSSDKCDNITNDYGSLEVFVRLGLGYDFPSSLRHSE